MGLLCLWGHVQALGESHERVDGGWELRGPVGTPGAPGDSGHPRSGLDGPPQGGVVEAGAWPGILKSEVGELSLHGHWRVEGGPLLKECPPPS